MNGEYDFLPLEQAREVTSENIYIAIMDDEVDLLTKDEVDFIIFLLKSFFKERVNLDGYSEIKCINYFLKCLESSLELAVLNRTFSVSFIGITNEKVYNFTSHRYVSFLSFDFIKPINAVLDICQWQLLYDLQNNLYMVYLSESAIELLAAFEQDYRDVSTTEMFQKIKRLVS